MEDDPHTVLAQLKADLDEVEAAMRRLDQGTYGRCEACGGEIPAGQLQASPTVRLCPNCS